MDLGIKVSLLVAMCLLCYAVQEGVGNPGLLGAPTEVNRSDKTFIEALAFAVESVNNLYISPTKLQLTELVDAKQQVEDGLMYHMTFQLDETGCKHNGTECEPKRGVPEFECTVRVRLEPTPEKKLTFIRGEPSSNCRVLTGLFVGEYIHW